MNAMGDPTENWGATYSQGMGREPPGLTGWITCYTEQPAPEGFSMPVPFGSLLSLGKANPDWSLAIQTTGLLVSLASLPPQTSRLGFHPAMGATKECTRGNLPSKGNRGRRLLKWNMIKHWRYVEDSTERLLRLLTILKKSEIPYWKNQRYNSSRAVSREIQKVTPPFPAAFQRLIVTKLTTTISARYML